jgi:hypothetical protein
MGSQTATVCLNVTAAVIELDCGSIRTSVRFRAIAHTDPNPTMTLWPVPPPLRPG